MGQYRRGLGKEGTRLVKVRVETYAVVPGLELVVIGGVAEGRGDVHWRRNVGRCVQGVVCVDGEGGEGESFVGVCWSRSRLVHGRLLAGEAIVVGRHGW